MVRICIRNVKEIVLIWQCTLRSDCHFVADGTKMFVYMPDLVDKVSKQNILDASETVGTYEVGSRTKCTLQMLSHHCRVIAVK